METKGRKDNQKMKPYLVYQYLLKESDENNVITAPEICAYLEEELVDALMYAEWIRDELFRAEEKEDNNAASNHN